MRCIPLRGFTLTGFPSRLAPAYRDGYLMDHTFPAETLPFRVLGSPFKKRGPR